MVAGGQEHQATVGEERSGVSWSSRPLANLSILQPTATTLLLHMDGLAGSTSFPDSSGNGYQLTASGNAQVDTTKKKFGTGSALFDGTAGTILSGPVSGIPAVNWPNDFTLDFWIQFSSLITPQSMYDNGNNFELMKAVDNDLLVSDTLSTITYLRSASNIITSTIDFYHVAVTRQATTLQIFLNGQVVAGVTNSLNFTGSGTYPFIGGGAGGGSLTTGNIDEFRIITGAAAWNTNFLPPSAPYPPP